MRELVGEAAVAGSRTAKLAALSSAILAAWGTTSSCPLLRHLTLFFFFSAANLCGGSLCGAKQPYNPLVAYSPPARMALLTGVTFDAKFYLKYLVFFYTSGLVTSPYKALQDMRGRVGRVPMSWPLLFTLFCLGIREDLLELGLKRQGNLAKTIIFVTLCCSTARAKLAQHRGRHFGRFPAPRFQASVLRSHGRRPAAHAASLCCDFWLGLDIFLSAVHLFVVCAGWRALCRRAPK